MNEIAAFKSVKLAVQVTCDGNRRKELNVIKHTEGFNFGPGATGCSMWKGVPLYVLLRHCGITYESVIEDGEAEGYRRKFVCFDGSDKLANGIYGASVPLEWAVDPLKDFIIAYEMNDAPLPPDHGFPARMILPGIVGGRMVKWLKRIVISNEESTSWYHGRDNKVLPSHVDKAISAKYWNKPEFSLYEMCLNSVITSPEHGTWIDIMRTTDKIPFKGFAYSGGGRRIISILLSLDGGESWNECDFKYPENAVRHGSRYWTWCLWSTEIAAWRLLGAKEVSVRAVDEAHNTQPEKLSWNLLGTRMMNNAYYRVKLRFSEFEKTERGKKPEAPRPWVQIQHPVLPGSASGGWMAPDGETADRAQILNGVVTDMETLGFHGSLTGKEFTMEQVAQHNKPDDCWIIVDGAIYDVTMYMDEHPGGGAPLALFAGGDASKAFHDIHAHDAYEILSWYRIGILERRNLVALGAKPRIDHLALITAEKWVDGKIVKVTQATKDVKRIRFDLKAGDLDKACKIGLPVGQHVLLQANVHGVDIARPYTPITPVGEDEDDGCLEFIIKISRPKNGESAGRHLTPYLDTLKEGDVVKMKGPCGPIIYFSEDCFLSHGNMFKAERINCVAGGTGITPMYQIIRGVLKGSEKVKVALLYANHSESDILMEQELEEMAAKFPDRFKYWPTISSTHDDGNWKGGEGHWKRMMRSNTSKWALPMSRSKAVLLVLLTLFAIFGGAACDPNKRPPLARKQSGERLPRVATDGDLHGASGPLAGGAAWVPGDDIAKEDGENEEETARRLQAQEEVMRAWTGGVKDHAALMRKVERYRLKTKEMFYHGLSSYMNVAYPKDELKPISGSGFDTLGNFSLTLVDALDTLMIMNDRTSFLRGVRLVSNLDFNIDVNVSVFETNIRVLGGLLSAHVMAALDPVISASYDWSLLDRAIEVGDRLVVAFDTPTGLPYGTVNLLRGVNEDESEDVCTACAGTFSLEFTWLSLLTDDPKYEQAARKAVRALWQRRSGIDLFGNHINVKTGEWTYKECTIGGLVDSFYEYLLKASIGFADEYEYDDMFWKAYRAVKIYMRRKDWHIDVAMDNGNSFNPLFYSLGAFWPGVKVLAGDVSEAMDELDMISILLADTNFLPEAFNLQKFQYVEGRLAYPLRPELVESLWVAFRATKSPSILELAFEIVDRLNSLTRTEFGFANVNNVRTMVLEDKMESFFLAETLKYLYLLFDLPNPYNHGAYVFNTEAHPFPVWSTRFTSRHPFETDDDLAHLRQPPPPVPPGVGPDAEESRYAGDLADAGVSGLREGVCWVDDWAVGREKVLSKWKLRRPVVVRE
ncbi:hypothetical protein HK101_008606 [Irineochytrium annulatum]|nr:hypothetical protein HK101_008606 [Irineochytrium annulatum]